MPGGRALHDQRQRGAVVDSVGDREDPALGRRGVFRVAARAHQRDDALARVLAHAGDLAARDQRQRRPLHVAVRARVGVGEVEPGAGHADQHLAGGRAAGSGSSARAEHLGAAELGHLDRAHGAEATGRVAHVPSSRVAKVRADADHSGGLDRLRRRQDAVRRARAHARRRGRAFRAGGVVLRRGARRRPGRRATSARSSWRCCAAAASTSPTSSASPDGKTFFWRGEYGWDLNSRETLDTELGVFEDFEPKLSERSRSSDVLFLANIQPRAAAAGARAAARKPASWRSTR